MPTRLSCARATRSTLVKITTATRNGKTGSGVKATPTKEDGVPRSLMTILGSTGTAREHYSARELSIHKGETLNVIAILNGWAWSRRTNGESGWVPLRNLEPHPVSKS